MSIQFSFLIFLILFRVATSNTLESKITNSTITKQEPIKKAPGVEHDDMSALMADIDFNIDETASDSTIEEPSTIEEVDEFDSLLSAISEEIDEAEKANEIEKEIPEAVKQIKKELEEKKQSVPIEAYFNSLTIKTPVDILLATASFMEKFDI